MAIAGKESEGDDSPSQKEALEVRVLVDAATGKSPFNLWYRKLRDSSAKVRILARLDRIKTAGNLGDMKPVGEGVFELRIDYGPGYRLYFARVGFEMILLLIGGDKRTQVSDIASAKALWAFNESKFDTESMNE